MDLDPVSRGEQKYLFFKHKFVANDTFSKILKPQESAQKITRTRSYSEM